MTVGQLAQRTGLSYKSIRELEGRGLIYSAGRSESGYRMFDENALWCVDAIAELRSLGLTLAEIEQIHAAYLEHPDQPTGRRLARALEHSEERIRARIAADRQKLRRIEAFWSQKREMLVGDSPLDLATDDPCRTRRRDARVTRVGS